MVWIIVVVLVIICLVLVFRLKQQQERVSALYKSDKLKSHFIKSLAYEIRSPLQSVMKLAEMVGRKDLYLSKEEKKHVADQISYMRSRTSVSVQTACVSVVLMPISIMYLRV